MHLADLTSKSEVDKSVISSTSKSITETKGHSSDKLTRQSSADEAKKRRTSNYFINKNKNNNSIKTRTDWNLQVKRILEENANKKKKMS